MFFLRGWVGGSASNRTLSSGGGGDLCKYGWSLRQSLLHIIIYHLLWTLSYQLGGEELSHSANHSTNSAIPWLNTNGTRRWLFSSYLFICWGLPGPTFLNFHELLVTKCYHVKVHNRTWMFEQNSMKMILRSNVQQSVMPLECYLYGVSIQKVPQILRRKTGKIPPNPVFLLKSHWNNTN